MHGRNLIRTTGTVLTFGLLAAVCLASQGCGTAAGPSMTVTPSSGPAGTEATISITGALPNAPVTLTVGPSSTNLTTDASGNASYTTTMDFPVGAVAISAIIGNANEQSASATFTVTQ